MYLKSARKKCGLTQREVADKTGLARASYSNIEKGKRKPSVSAAKRIAAVLGFDWTEFFQETDRPA